MRVHKKQEDWKKEKEHIFIFRIVVMLACRQRLIVDVGEQRADGMSARLACSCRDVI